MASVVVLLTMVILALAAPLVCPFPYDELHMGDLRGGQPLPPGDKYLLGTDNYGRDYLTRLVYGGRVSLLVGCVSMSISMLIGVPLACFAGYFGGVYDQAVLRLIEFFACVPTLFLILAINGMVKKASIFYVMAVIGLFGWMGVCRQVRAQFLSLRQSEFVQAAFALGYRDGWIIFRHILPNAMMPVIIHSTMSVAGAIMTESSLSYLGMGVQEPIPSWGAMLRIGKSYLRTSPHMAILPGLCILMACLSLNFLGDGLRDALDPRAFRR
jgi:peptide/nickel transport system permease protein